MGNPDVDLRYSRIGHPTISMLGWHRATSSDNKEKENSDIIKNSNKNHVKIDVNSNNVQSLEEVQVSLETSKIEDLNESSASEFEYDITERSSLSLLAQAEQVYKLEHPASDIEGNLKKH